MASEYFAYVYILTNFRKSTLYIGVTTNLKQRISDHKNGIGSIFTQKYKVYKLIWYQGFEKIEDAITKEKQIKRWRRAWKDEMISTFNPDWKDLFWEIMGY